MLSRRLVPLLTILALACTGCAAQSREETKILLEELTFVRVALKKQREELKKLKQQTAALAALVERMARARASSDAAATPEPVSSGPGPGFSKVSVHHYRITRAALNRSLANTNLLAQGARIVPALRNGRPFGFKLYAIRPFSIYAAIGLKNGDNIFRVNGLSITTPDRALEVYTKLRSASKISLELMRKGKPVMMRYEIVD